MKNLTFTGFRKVITCVCLCFVCILNGCAMVQEDTQLYENIRNQTQMFTEGQNIQSGGQKIDFSEKAYDFCRGLQKVAPFVCVGSWLLMGLILYLIREDQTLRGKAFWTFGVFIPAVMGVLSYLLPYLIGTYL